MTRQAGKPVGNGSEPLKTVFLLESDLLFQVRLEKSLEKQDCRVVNVQSVSQLADALTEPAPALIILNFASRNPNPMEATAQLHAAFPGTPILGYFSHTRIPEIKVQAKAAGVTLLVPNSVIVTRLPQLLERLLPKEGETPDISGAERIADEAE